MKPLKQHKAPQNKNLLEKDLSVLLVDDNKVNQFLGKRILAQLGITQVELAGDGTTAFELIKSQHFDALLTDVEMPGMSGYELCEAIRKLPSPENSIIIIALTANGTPTEKEKALALGMNDYLIKPYSPQELLDVLLGHVETRKGILIKDFVKPVVQNATPVMHIYALFNNSRADAMGLLQMLSKQIPELIQEIKQAIVKSDWDTTFQSSHKLKSTIKLFGDEHLTALIFEINENARERKLLDQLPDAFERFVNGTEGILMIINKELESQ